MCDVETIKKIAHCLGINPGKVVVNEEQMVTRTDKNNKSATGFSTILTRMAVESKADAAINSLTSPSVEAQVYQWIEYAILFAAPGSKDKQVAKHLLRDLNRNFGSKSYLVGYTLTIADLAVFYAIYDLMKSLSPIDKEHYLNLSRWFDHLQQMPEVRQGNSLLNFTTIYLHGWATGTHL